MPTATTRSNFVLFTTALGGGALAPSLIACTSGAVQLAQNGGGAVVDILKANLLTAGYAKNGCVALALSASTPVTVDFTSTSTGTSAVAGDTSFANLQELTFFNAGTQDVMVTLPASNPLAAWWKGTAPGFTIPANSQITLRCPPGYPVSGTAKGLTFDPGTAAALLAVAIGGA